MNKKIIAVMTSLLIASLVLLVACAPKPAVPTETTAVETTTVETTTAKEVEKKTIRVTVIPGPVGEMMKFQAEAFMKVRPDVEVKVEVAGGAEDEYKSAFPLIAASPDRPDVAWYWVDGRQYQDLVAGGILEPLDDLYEREGWLFVFNSSIFSLGFIHQLSSI